MKYLGIKWAKGQKNYNEPWKRVNKHATVIFYDEKKKKYYFINLTSTKEAMLRDILRTPKGGIVIVAKDVWNGRQLEKEHKLNIMNSVAVIDEEFVETNQKYAENALSEIKIMGNYKMSNYSEFEKLILKILYKFGINGQLFCYNGNDDNYQSPDLNDSKLPLELKRLICSLVKKDHLEG